MSILTVDQVKEYLRYDAADTSNDDALQIIVNAGQRKIENYTGHILVQREVTEGFAVFPTAPLDLRWKPYVADSLTVGYLDSDLVLDETFDAFTIYTVNGASRVIASDGWPSGSGVTFSYTAGYSTVDDVPEDLLHALCAYAALGDKERALQSEDSWGLFYEICKEYHLPVLA